MMFRPDNDKGGNRAAVLLLPVLHGEKVGMRGCFR